MVTVGAHAVRIYDDKRVAANVAAKLGGHIWHARPQWRRQAIDASLLASVDGDTGTSSETGSDSD